MYISLYKNFTQLENANKGIPTCWKWCVMVLKEENEFGIGWILYNGGGDKKFLPTVHSSVPLKSRTDKRRNKWERPNKIEIKRKEETGQKPFPSPRRFQGEVFILQIATVAVASLLLFSSISLLYSLSTEDHEAFSKLMARYVGIRN